MKHNKKRNTAFLYEALVQEYTKNVINKDEQNKSIILDILKEHFSKGRILHAELSLYKCVHESKNLDRKIADKILYEAKMDYNYLPKDKIFAEQSRVINKINKSLGQSIFSNFVPDYKNLASISQFFNSSLPVKDRVLLEETLIGKMCDASKQETDKLIAIDNLTYKTFIKKFNEKYTDSLIKEQKELLTNYLVSFSDNGISLKIFLNEEISRIKQELDKTKQTTEIKEDSVMVEKINKIIEKLKLFKEKEFDKKMLQELLKIQYFVNEANKNG